MAGAVRCAPPLQAEGEDVKIVQLFRREHEPEGADWRKASEAVEPHVPTLDELMDAAAAAETRISDAAVEMVAAIRSYHTVQDRICEAMKDKGARFDIKPHRVSGDEIADEIDKALQGVTACDS